MRYSMRLSGLPSLDEWAEEEFTTALSELQYSDWCTGIKRRDEWEKARCLVALQSLGLVRPTLDCLAVAAGRERLMFYLSRKLHSVTAIDRYDGSWKSTPADFPANPQKYAPIGFDHDRLRVMRMDARRLAFKDASFDFVYSLGPALNWFGGKRGAVEALREMERVVKPDGWVLASVECVIRGGSHKLFFDLEMLDAELISRTSLRPLEPLELDAGGLEGLPRTRSVLPFPPATPESPNLLRRYVRGSRSLFRPAYGATFMLVLRRPAT
jgi:SAM-dependent methyltransferase